MKLARQLGWFNVDAMLETAEAGQLDEWLEYERINPSGDDWTRSSMIATQIINAITTAMAGFGGGRVSDRELLPVDAFVPHAAVADENLRGAMAAIRAQEGL